MKIEQLNQIRTLLCNQLLKRYVYELISYDSYDMTFGDLNIVTLYYFWNINAKYKWKCMYQHYIIQYYIVPFQTS